MPSLAHFILNLHRARYNRKRLKMETTIVQKVFRYLLGASMSFAGLGHLSFQREEFQAQVPRWLPSDPGFMDFIVLSSGFIEIALGLTLMFWWSKKHYIGIALAIFYILIFPGNISQYQNDISAFGLDTEQKRLIRLFFQPVLILWALWSSGGLKYLKQRRKSKNKNHE